MPSLEDFIDTTYTPDVPLETTETKFNPLSEVSQFTETQDMPISTENGASNEDSDELAHITAGSRCEAKKLYEKTNAFGTEWVEDIPTNFLTQDDVEQWAEFAVLLRTRLVDGKPRLHSIVVQSPVLKAKLKQIFTGYLGINLGAKSWTAETPFKPFVHRWTEFISACEVNDEDETTRHMQLLREALEPELRDTFLTISEFQAGGGIEFNQLWMIFNPGRMIFTEKSGTECAYKLLRTQIHLSEEQNQKFFLLHCCYIDYDGNKVGYALIMEAITEYEDCKTRDELGVYPLDVHEDATAVKKRLVERGRQYKSVMGVSYRAYDGHAFDETQRPPLKHYVKDRIVIDSGKWFLDLFRSLQRALSNWFQDQAFVSVGYTFIWEISIPLSL
jgi:hypothetical protein